MVTFEGIVNTLTDQHLSKDFKESFINEEDLNAEDLIDIANYVSIERNFYVRRCEKLQSKLDSKK